MKLIKGHRKKKIVALTFCIESQGSREKKKKEEKKTEENLLLQFLLQILSSRKLDSVGFTEQFLHVYVKCFTILRDRSATVAKQLNFIKW